MSVINCPDHGITKFTNIISKSGVRGVVCSECFAKFKGRWEEEKPEIVFIYIVELDDKKTWAFKNKEDAIDLMENKLHMKKDKAGDGWGIKGYQNKAKLITLELE